jgi:hypothetical protein
MVKELPSYNYWEFLTVHGRKERQKSNDKSHQNTMIDFQIGLVISPGNICVFIYSRKKCHILVGHNLCVHDVKNFREKGRMLSILYGKLFSGNWQL